MAKPKLYYTIKSYLGSRYNPSDDELIDLYCSTRKMYNDMLKDLKKTGYLVEHTNKAGATNLVKNPLAIEVTKTAQVLNQLLKSLGLTAAQRKTVTEGGEGGDDFESF